MHRLPTIFHPCGPIFRAMAAGLLMAAMFLVPARGQVASLRTANTEIGGFGGVSFGIDTVRGMGGGNVAYAVTRVIMPYGEFSYFPGIGRRETIATRSGSVQRTFELPLADIHGGVHLRVPIPESRVIPYGVLGAGVVHFYSVSERIQVQDALGPFEIPYTVPSRSDFAVNFGGGLRFYVHENFGFRLEAKMYKPTGTYNDMFGKFVGGIFFQIH